MTARGVPRLAPSRAGRGRAASADDSSAPAWPRPARRLARAGWWPSGLAPTLRQARQLSSCCGPEQTRVAVGERPHQFVVEVVYGSGFRRNLLFVEVAG